MYIIGIDGGGTKTTGVLCHVRSGENAPTPSIEIVAKETVGATNPTHVEKETIQQRLQHLIKKLASKNGNLTEVTSVFAGMSGMSKFTEEDIQALEEIIRVHTSDSVEIIITNDAITALYSATLGRPGIVNIAGTGAITFGINGKNEMGRAGGWGYLIDHSGCGYGLGLEGLKVLFKEYDEQMGDSILTKLIKQRLKINAAPEALNLIYHPSEFRHHIASLAPDVFQAATEGDVHAKKIITTASKEIAESVKVLLNRLFSEEKEPITVVCTGGLFQQRDVLIPLMEKELEGEHDVRIIVPELSPVAGAVVGALKEKGINIVRDDWTKQMGW
ncbi:N-acetylglucosamine kinase-like BadF-type ATPase [Evansella vedderi]|uniref:N-acetylglucosamine kinase-like BadF-type ATPase n=1 Tax=Evansella vedderi TaxID=38282 RepID=A0ABU0A0A1_9BACI|nr:BadF/BadG/BcrA/BcrD ATPase family protein [Evansella vedderi]MDQ0256640.1 N-acetylglucosamine kinase-like BadF-type ATPase [Evansella vedderi]